MSNFFINPKNYNQRDQLMYYKISIILFILFISIYTNYADNGHTKGSIKRFIMDAETKLPIIGAHIFIKDNVHGAASDITASFEITTVHLGNYVLQFRYIGYQSVT